MGIVRRREGEGQDYKGAKGNFGGDGYGNSLDCGDGSMGVYMYIYIYVKTLNCTF